MQGGYEVSDGFFVDDGFDRGPLVFEGGDGGRVEGGEDGADGVEFFGGGVHLEQHAGLGGEGGFLVGALSMLLSNIVFGQGPWTPWQMFSFGIIGFLTGILFQKGLLQKNKTQLCIFGFLITLVVYGGIMNPVSVLLWQTNPTVEMILSSYLMGLPFDLIHSVSTAFFLWFAAEPMCEKLERIKLKYGLKE